MSLSTLCKVLLASLVATAGVYATTINVINVIPVGDSGETSQDSEPSIAVNPANPMQIIAGAFGATTFFNSTNGGTAFSNFQTITTFDKSIAYSPNSGRAYVASIYSNPNPNTTFVETRSTASGPGFGTQIDNQATTNTFIDQPWIRVGNDGSGLTTGDRIYETGNYFVGVSSSANTATIHYSTNGGSTWSTLTLETASPGAGQDSPAVREAVSGNTVYTAWDRWNSVVSTTGGGDRFGSTIMIRRDDNGGIGGTPFQALNGTAGIAADTGIDTVFSTADNSSLTLGLEREGSGLAIAVDPNNASHVYLVYQQSPAIGQLGLIVSESTDGGATWHRVETFATGGGLRTGEPAIAVSGNGTVGLLYNEYDASSSNSTGMLSQHFMYTTNDFASTTDLVLAQFINGSIASAFDPYLGDYFDLMTVGNVFYGVFSSSNKDDGTNASFPHGVTFQRGFTGTPGTGSFQLSNGSPVAFSIDPYMFTFDNTSIPEPGTTLLLAGGLAFIAAFRKRVGRASRPVRGS